MEPEIDYDDPLYNNGEEESDENEATNRWSNVHVDLEMDHVFLDEDQEEEEDAAEWAFVIVWNFQRPCYSMYVSIRHVHGQLWKGVCVSVERILNQDLGKDFITSLTLIWSMDFSNHDLACGLTRFRPADAKLLYETHMCIVLVFITRNRATAELFLICFWNDPNQI